MTDVSLRAEYEDDIAGLRQLVRIEIGIDNHFINSLSPFAQARLQATFDQLEDRRIKPLARLYYILDLLAEYSGEEPGGVEPLSNLQRHGERQLDLTTYKEDPDA